MSDITGYVVGDDGTMRPIIDGEVEVADEGDDHSSWKVDDLRAEIDRRNADRDEDDQIPDKGKKADLVAALELDDEQQG